MYAIRRAQDKGMYGMGMEEVMGMVWDIPYTIHHHMPYTLMWCMVMTVYVCLYVMGVPILIILCMVYVYGIPERVPPTLERYLQMIIPTRILYPPLA